MKTIHSILRRIIYCLLAVIMLVLVVSCDDEMKFMAEGDPMQISVNATTKYSGAQSRAILGDEVEITGYTFLYYVKKDGNLTLSNKTYSATVPFNVVLECPGTESNLAILIANAPEDAFDNLALGSKLSDLNDITYDVTHYDNDPSSAKEFTWSGFCEVKQDTRKISFTLNPNVAKITVKIIDNSSESQVVNLRMKRVRNKVRYAQNALYRSGHSNEATVAQINRGYVNYDMEDMNLSKVGDNTYSWYVPHNEPIHVSGQTYSREAGLVPSGSTFLEIDGLRLTDYQCTSYRIYPGVSEKDGEGNIKEYNYLSNYNIIADYQYSIEVTINDDGIAYSGDSDLKWYYPDNYNTSLKVKLPGKSNSYMIHPKAQSQNNGTNKATGDIIRRTVWEIPVHERVNEYWETVKKDPSRTLTKYSKWQVEVIWQDINGRALYFSDELGNKETYKDIYKGEGLNPIYFVLNYDKVLKKEDNVTYNTTNDIYGNILIGLKLLDDNGNVVTFSDNNTYRGLRSDGKSDYLWSWHLWVTDYCPDGAPANTSKTTLYYSGENVVDYQGYMFKSNLSSSTYTKSFIGNVQHYWHYGGTTFLYSKSEAIWTNGIYKNKWIMDRNIGAQSAHNGLTEDPIEGFGLYYQYGRKDPFPYHGADHSKQETGYQYSIYEIDGTTTVAPWVHTAGKVPMNVGVMNPMLFFSYGATAGASWTEDTNTRPWFSPDTETAVTATNGKKTLFDPCPPGWCIPKYDTFDFMCANNGVYVSTDGTVAYPFIYYGYAHSSVGVIPNNRVRHYTRAQIRTSGSADYLQINFPIQGYISPSGVNGSTLQLPKSDHNLDLRGYMWTAEACDASQFARGIGYGTTATQQSSNAECLIDNVSYIKEFPKLSNGYFLQGIRGAYYAAYSASRGQNVRCIQEP